MFELIKIAANSFIMDASGTAKDAHHIEMTLTKDFYIGKYLITQAEWLSIMGTSPWQGVSAEKGYREGPRYPAVGLTWQECVNFTKHASEKLGKNVHLPTEAQWECALRAGTRTRFFWGDEYLDGLEFAWTSRKNEPYLHEVGLLKPNPWGLFDMAGNVREWVLDRCEVSKYSPDVEEGHYPKKATDWYSKDGSIGIVRNASFSASLFEATNYYNKVVHPEKRSVEFGFRVVVEG